MAEKAGAVLLTSGVWLAPTGEKAVALLAAQPAKRPGEYILDVTLVSELPLPPGLRLSVRWAEGRRTARVRADATARVRGVPAYAIEALQAGDAGALLIQIDQAS